jgi:hypothetical protein
MFRGLVERDDLFVLEMLCHCEEDKLTPCGVPHAHLLQNAAGLGKTRQGMGGGVIGKLACGRMETWHTPNVRHPL